MDTTDGRGGGGGGGRVARSSSVVLPRSLTRRRRRRGTVDCGMSSAFPSFKIRSGNRRLLVSKQNEGGWIGDALTDDASFCGLPSFLGLHLELELSGEKEEEEEMSGEARNRTRSD